MEDSKITNTARVGYKPEFDQPVGKIILSLNDLRPPRGTSETGKIGEIDSEDLKAIQEFLEEYTDARNKLEDFDKQLDNFLVNGLGEPFSISYDPDKYPDVNEAHHHICGRPNASNVITYEDIKNRALTERALLASSIGLPESLDELNEMNGAEIQSKISKKVEKAIAQMLDMVWRQILIWVLEFMYKTVKPLESITFVKTLPKLIKRAIDRLRKKTDANPDNIDSLLGDVDIKSDGEISAEDLAKAGGGYISSIKEIVQELPPECLIHTSNWNRFVDSVVRDGPYASAYYAKKVNSGILGRMDAINKMAAIGIPNGQVFTYKGTSLTYTNPLPDEYLQARADGSTKFGAISEGLITSVRDVGSTVIPRMENIVRNLASDPNLLCCLIRNISLIANTQKLRRVLLTIQALLQFWRNLHTLDISKELARLGNMIMDLVNTVLQSIFSLYISFFNSKLSKIALQVKDLQKFTHVSAECRPWNEFINMAVDILTEMLKKISDYFLGFIMQLRLDIKTSADVLDDVQKLSKIDKYLDLINKILKFTAAWAACIESKQDPRVILAQGDRLTSTGSGISLAPGSATSKAGALSPDSSDSSRISSGSTVTTGTITGNGTGAKATFTSDGPFSADGLQVLLTNYLGVESGAVKGIINSIDDCSCDKSLTPEELASIERFLEEKT